MLYGELDVDGSDLVAWLDLTEDQFRDLGSLAGNFGKTDGAVGSESPVTISFDGSTATVDNPFEATGVSVSISGGDVIVTAIAGIPGIVYRLSGTSPDGMFKICLDSDFTLQLNGVDITNADGPAINIQSKETVSLVLFSGA